MDKINPQVGSYSFDHWAQLARDNPAEFNNLRDEEISKLIASAPPEYRLKLKQHQFRIDAIRHKYRKNQQVCVNALYYMMLRSLGGLGDHLHDFESDLNELEAMLYSVSVPSSETKLTVIK